MEHNLPKNQLALLGFEGQISKTLCFWEHIRFKKGGYPARTSKDSIASVTTTAVICIARKKAGEITLPIDSKTEEDIDYIIKNFDEDINAWKIFGNEIPSPWTTAFCTWALSILDKGDLDCVKKAVETLLSWQVEGGWGIMPRNNKEILVSYMVTKALISYYFEYNYNKAKIEEKLKLTAKYFEEKLDKEVINNLNITDCALAFQGIHDIYSSSIIKGLLEKRKIESLRKRTFDRLHNLISLGKYVEQTKIKITVKTGEWHIYHFHPAVLPIMSQHHGDPFDIFKLLTWFNESFLEFNGSMGMWQHFANKDETYTTALALYALYDFVGRSDFFNVLKEKILEIEKENKRLKEENRKLKQNIKERILQSLKQYGWLILAILGAIGGIIWVMNKLLAFLKG